MDAVELPCTHHIIDIVNIIRVSSTSKMRVVFLPDCLNGRLRSEPSNCQQRAAAFGFGLIALSYVSNSQDLSQFLASVGSIAVIATAAGAASAFAVAGARGQPACGACCSSGSCSGQQSPPTQTWSRTKTPPSVLQPAFIAA